MGADEPTGRLPAVPEKFAPGRAHVGPAIEDDPISAMPVTAAYPDYPGPVAVAYPTGLTRGYVLGTARTNGTAIAALVCSIAGLFSCFAVSLIGAILGHVARKQIRERGEGGDGMATAGIVMGWIGVGIMIALFMLFVFGLGFS